MIAIIVALDTEAKAVIDKFCLKQTSVKAGKRVFTGKICDKDVALALSGIGKVNASLTTQMMIDEFSPDYVLNFGTCGGINDNVKALEYYAVDNCCQYDFDLSELDDVSVGYIQDYDTVFFNVSTYGLDFLEKTNLASADRFTDKPMFLDIIRSLSCEIRDMEGGAIAQVCKSNDVTLFMIKGVSDVFGSGSSAEQFYANLKSVCEGFPVIIEKVIANATL